MSIFLNRLKTGHPHPLTANQDWDGCWRIYTVCKTSNPASCITRSDISDLNSIERNNARTALTTFSNRAHTGQPFSELYDAKQCHEALAFIMQPAGNEVKIWRVWGTGTIRIYFCYLPEKNVVILNVASKRQNKLSSGEKIELESRAREVLDYLGSVKFEMILI